MAKLEFRDRSVHIIGTANLQNQLLSSVLKDRLGVRCVIVENMASGADQDDRQAGDDLLLIDCRNGVRENILNEIESGERQQAKSPLMALFNVRHEWSLEKRALLLGVRGFFYQNENLHLLLKGIRTLFAGEIWLSRNILVDCVLGEHGMSSPSPEDVALTKRELEVLALVSSGLTNQEIAERLFISPHTVKTHIYRIFKKIDVPNRLQAALWAAKSLS